MFFDTARPLQINLQDSATYGMEMIVQLHNYVMFINVFIISVVVWFFFEIIAITGFLRWFSYRVFIINLKKVCVSQLIYKQINNSMLHMSTLEIVWTLLPVLALITIALPSLSMLYYFSMSFSPAVIVNVIGHQWFWSYEYHYSSEITAHQIYSESILQRPMFDYDFLAEDDESLSLTESFLDSQDPSTFIEAEELTFDQEEALFELTEMACEFYSQKLTYILKKNPDLKKEIESTIVSIRDYTSNELEQWYLLNPDHLDVDPILNNDALINSIFGRESFDELFNMYCEDLNLASTDAIASQTYQMFGFSQTEGEINNFNVVFENVEESHSLNDSDLLFYNLLLATDFGFIEGCFIDVEGREALSVFEELFAPMFLSNVDEISLKSDINSLYFNNDTIEKFDSIMTQVEDLTSGSFRLLEVDKPLYLPVDVPIRVIVSSDDVLHSWAVPSLGVKIDCVPGRLNVVEFRIARQGVFYGQCSEICGTQHGFMPICIVTMPRKLFYFI